jgi:hypothetical protein
MVKKLIQAPNAKQLLQMSKSVGHKCILRDSTGPGSSPPRKQKTMMSWSSGSQEVNVQPRLLFFLMMHCRRSSILWSNWHHDKSEPGREKDGGISKL